MMITINNKYYEQQSLALLKGGTSPATIPRLLRFPPLLILLLKGMPCQDGAGLGVGPQASWNDHRPDLAKEGEKEL